MFGRGRKTHERVEPSFERAQTARPAGLRASRDDAPGAKGRQQIKSMRESARPRRQRRGFFGALFYWGFVLSIWGLIGVSGLVVYHFNQLPPIDQLAVPKRPPNIAILGEDGALVATRGDTGGAAVHLRELPPYLPKAFVSIEDRRFYSHFGIDPVGIARAVFRNLTRRGGMQGGSTLTQQLAKNLFLTQERTMSRKIQEAILALWLEHKYSKDQILELYLNRVYFGSGAYGVEAASRKYFGKSARMVTLSEAAVLAGLMKAPTRLAPNHNPTGAMERAAQVITAMAQEGHITESMAKLALSRPAEAVHEDGAGSVNYAADHVMDVLDDTVGAIDEDIVVSTTLNPALQAVAEKALTEELAAKGTKYGVSQGALVMMDTNGAIKALVGGRNYADSQFNRAVSAQRQPGSAFKPFVFLAALERGLTPDTLREDAKINVKGWEPENYSQQYQGPVTLTQALAQSLNTVAVRLGLEAGAKSVAKVAHRLGIQSDLQINASLALGTSEVTPLELVTAYAPFANGGIGVQDHIILKVRTADGKLLYQRRATGNGRIIEPQYVAMMNRMLGEVLASGTAKKAELPGWQAAGKTGTSQDYRDAWFVGYTSHMITGVWLGNDDNSPTRKSVGGNLPVDIWNVVMKAAHQGVPPAALPSGVWQDPAGAGPLVPAPPPEPAVAVAPARPVAPLADSGAPLTINQAGQAIADKTAPATASPPRRDPGALVPPAPIPAATRAPPPAAPKKGLLEKLFGG